MDPIEAEAQALLRQLPNRQHAIEAGLDRVLPQLLSKSHAVRRAGCRALTGFDRALVEPVLLVMVGRARAEVVEVGLEGLAAIESQRLRGCVAAVIASHDPDIQQCALRVAQRMRGDTARAFFLYASLDASIELRRKAVLYLSWRTDGWVEHCLRSLANDGEPLVSWPALRALMVRDGEAARETLEQATFRPFPGYRRLMARLIRGQSPVVPKGTRLAARQNERRDPVPVADQRRRLRPKAEPSSIRPSAPPESDGAGTDAEGRPSVEWLADDSGRGGTHRGRHAASDAPPPHQSVRRTMPPKAAPSTIRPPPQSAGDDPSE